MNHFWNRTLATAVVIVLVSIHLAAVAGSSWQVNSALYECCCPDNPSCGGGCFMCRNTRFSCYCDTCSCYSDDGETSSNVNHAEIMGLLLRGGTRRGNRRQRDTRDN